jgi:hypothetical protein
MSALDAESLREYSCCRNPREPHRTVALQGVAVRCCSAPSRRPVGRPGPGDGLRTGQLGWSDGRVLTDQRRSHEGFYRSRVRRLRATVGIITVAATRCSPRRSIMTEHAPDHVHTADERTRHWRGVDSKPLMRLTLAARETCLDKSWWRWDSQSRARRTAATGLEREATPGPRIPSLRQARDGASQCCGPFSSYWPSSRSRYSSLAASAAAGAASKGTSPTRPRPVDSEGRLDEWALELWGRTTCPQCSTCSVPIVSLGTGLDRHRTLASHPSIRAIFRLTPGRTPPSRSKLETARILGHLHGDVTPAPGTREEIHLP